MHLVDTIPENEYMGLVDAKISIHANTNHSCAITKWTRNFRMTGFTLCTVTFTTCIDDI